MGALQFEPKLEILEDRITPSAVSINGVRLEIVPTVGIANHLIVQTTATTIALFDAEETFDNVPAGWATSEGDHVATGPKGDITVIGANLGAEDDYFDGSGSDIRVDIEGGLGDDILYGGSAGDQLN